jgi:hypothetical protein
MASEQLKRKAEQAVCACYYYELVNAVDDMTSEDLQMIVNDPFYCHKINDDEMDDCPQWQHEHAETIKDGMREDGIHV